MDFVISVLAFFIAAVIVYCGLNATSMRADFNKRHVDSGDEITPLFLGNTEKAKSHARKIRAYGHRTTLFVVVCIVVLALLNEFFS